MNIIVSSKKTLASILLFVVAGILVVGLAGYVAIKLYEAAVTSQGKKWCPNHGNTNIMDQSVVSPIIDTNSVKVDFAYWKDARWWNEWVEDDEGTIISLTGDESLNLEGTTSSSVLAPVYPTPVIYTWLNPTGGVVLQITMGDSPSSMIAFSNLNMAMYPDGEFFSGAPDFNWRVGVPPTGEGRVTVDLQRSTNLVHWKKIVTFDVNPGLTNVFRDETAPLVDRCFYRTVHP